MKTEPNAPQDDWRLGGQEKYLHGVTLNHRDYNRTSESWDHDHRAFCWAKFMGEDHPDVLHEDYCTEDGYHWVCKACFEDFRERFEWVIGTGAAAN